MPPSFSLSFVVFFALYGSHSISFTRAHGILKFAHLLAYSTCSSVRCIDSADCVAPWLAFPCCRIYQVAFAFKTLYNVRVLQPDGTESILPKNLQDFMSLYISTGNAHI